MELVMNAVAVNPDLVENQMVVDPPYVKPVVVEVDPDLRQTYLAYAQARVAIVSDAELDQHIELLTALERAPEPIVNYIRSIQRDMIVERMVSDGGDV